VGRNDFAVKNDAIHIEIGGLAASASKQVRMLRRREMKGQLLPCSNKSQSG
jgi:hypothetical protein